MKRLGMFLMCIVTLLVFSSVFAQDAEDVDAADYLFYFGGSAGGAAGSTEGIRDLAVTAAGDILVLDVYNHISEFNHYGEFMTVHEGDADGNAFEGFIGPMTTDTAGNIYLAQYEPYRITVFDSEFHLTNTITLDFEQNPLELVYDDANGLLYILSFYYEQGESPEIVVLNADGEVVNRFFTPLPEGIDAANVGGFDLTPDGNVVFGYGGMSRQTRSLDAISGAVQTYQTDGTLLLQRDLEYTEYEEMTTEGPEVFRLYPAPFGVTVDSVGRIYAYEATYLPPREEDPDGGITGTFTITAPNGTLLRQISVSRSDSPLFAHIALSPDEQTLYVATENYVHVISLTTEPEFTTARLTDNARVRSGPDSSNELITTLPADTIVIVLGTNVAGDWLQIRANGGEGWVASFLTEPVLQ